METGTNTYSVEVIELEEFIIEEVQLSRKLALTRMVLDNLPP